MTRTKIFEIAKTCINADEPSNSFENRIADKLMDLMDLIESGYEDLAKTKFYSIIKYLELSQKTLIRLHHIEFCNNILSNLNKNRP